MRSTSFAKAKRIPIAPTNCNLKEFSTKKAQMTFIFSGVIETNFGTDHVHYFARNVLTYGTEGCPKTTISTGR